MPYRRVERLHGYMVKMPAHIATPSTAGRLNRYIVKSSTPSPTSLRPAVAGLRRVERLRRARESLQR